MIDSSNLNRVLEEIKPDEIYNLAAQSHVKVSLLVRGLLRELERNKDWDAGALVDKMQEKEFSTIVEALKVFDMVNLKENARLATEMLAEAGEGNSMS